MDIHGTKRQLNIRSKSQLTVWLRQYHEQGIEGLIGIVLSAYMLRLRYLKALENANSAKSVECVNLIFGLIAAINLSLGISALFVHPALAVVLMFP